MERQEIEELLSSRGRVKILRILAEEKETNITQITKKSMLNHSAAVSHLNKLVKAGLASEKRFGKIRIFKFQDENPVAQKVVELLETWRRRGTLFPRTHRLSTRHEIAKAPLHHDEAL